MTRRYWLIAVFILVSFLAAWAAAFEVFSLRAKGGSILPLLVWVAVWIATVVLLAMRLLGLARGSGGQAGLSEVIEGLPVGFALYDSDGRLTYCNETFRRTFPDPAVLRKADGDLEVVRGQWVRLHRRNLAGGGSAVAASDITREVKLQTEKREEAIRYQRFLFAAAEWIWETDVLHRFSMIRAVAADGRLGGFDGMVGRSLFELADGGTVADSWIAENSLRDMDRRSPLRNLRLTLHVDGQARPVRLSGVPRNDEAGEFLGYCGVGLWEEEEMAPETVAEESSQPPTTGTTRPLLLVDDSATNRQLAESMLKRMGYEVTAVDGGQKAVEAVRTGKYSAVLMDIWMPEMDGFEATAAIRELPAPYRDIPVIAMTAHTGAEERRRCLDSGMDEHVGKPIDRAMLAVVLRRLAGPPPGANIPDEEAGGAPFSPEGAELVNDEVLEQLRNDAGPALVNELIGAYMAETDERLIRIESAFKAGKLEEVGADAHSMKSSSGTFGALPLQALAARLEAAAMLEDLAGVSAAHEELPKLVSETWAAFAARGFRRE